jgi:hypothetical protein
MDKDTYKGEEMTEEMIKKRHFKNKTKKQPPAFEDKEYDYVGDE